MTGRQAYDHGVGNPDTLYSPAKLQDDEFTLAELLASAGNTTGLFGKWHLGENDPPDDWADGDEWTDHLGQAYTHALNPNTHGFSHYWGSLSGGVEDYWRWTAHDATTASDGTVTTSAWRVTVPSDEVVAIQGNGWLDVPDCAS
jgi:arylsulfatase A-like enzyme